MTGADQIFLKLFAAKVLMIACILAVVLGLLLTVTGIPAAWLAWSGALLSVLAFVRLRAFARRTQLQLNNIAEEGLTTIYMPLLNEGVDVWRPVEAIKITDVGYMVTENASADEEWAFQPGHILRCEERDLSGGTHLVAVAKAT
jgi:hypothetical protein